MTSNEFRSYAHTFVDWMADYLETIEQYPVKSQTHPGEIDKQLPPTAPENAETIETIFEDFKNIILPGMTHWQHPQFFAYFPANASPPSILAEMLTATLAAQCMSWQTSPAATELETKVLDWLKKMIGLPNQFAGVIQDTASTATLCALLTARERTFNFQTNLNGISKTQTATVYCSSEAHSSVEKAVKIAGLGENNLRKIKINPSFAMDAKSLLNAIQDDIKQGYKPVCVIATLGTTSTGGIDDIETIGKICKQNNIWLHVDAAWAGSALILPEYQWMLKGTDFIDSLVFNPHKWLLTQFDCSAYYVKHKPSLIKTLGIIPEYLKTEQDSQVVNYRDWGIALGRRFRALKLWFVIRYYGVEGLQQHIRKHIHYADIFEEKINSTDDFELMAPKSLALICFRYHPKQCNDEEQLSRINQELLNKLNASGRCFLTHTRIHNKYSIRLAIGSPYTTEKHVQQVWDDIKQAAADDDLIS